MQNKKNGYFHPVQWKKPLKNDYFSMVFLEIWNFIKHNIISWADGTGGAIAPLIFLEKGKK